MRRDEIDPLIYRKLQALKGMGRPFLIYCGDIVYRVEEIETIESKDALAPAVYVRCQNGETAQVVMCHIEEIVRRGGHTA